MSEVVPRERSGRPDIDSQEGAWPQQIVIGYDETEDKRISNVTEDGENHSLIWGMFMDCNNGISSIHGKKIT